MHIKFWSENLMGQHHLTDLNNVETKLKKIGYEDYVLDPCGAWGAMVGSWEHGNEPSCSIKGGKFFA